MIRRSLGFLFLVLAFGLSLGCSASVPALAKNPRIVSGKAQVLMVNTLKVDNKIVDLKWIMGPSEYRPTIRYAHPEIGSPPFTQQLSMRSKNASALNQ